MAARNPQTLAKRAREQAVKERRERKRAKKAGAAAAPAAARAVPTDGVGDAEASVPPDAVTPPPQASL